ncbi:thymidylate kinase [Mycoplasmatota bacterium]|nr:thymidylate kinase [Mycoplasmatota bacterium]
MKNKLIMIEGIPGSGKTTLSKRLEKFLTEKNLNVNLYNEGDIHPVDLAWTALLEKDEFEDLLKKFPKYKDIIIKNSKEENEYVLVAYSLLGIGKDEPDLVEYFKSHAVYEKNDIDEFIDVHLKRWKAFSKSCDDSVYIFECAFLQNHISKLLVQHNISTNIIKEHLANLLDSISELNPRLIYLSQENIEETINRVAKERLSPDKSKWSDWIDLAIQYVEKSEYGKVNNLTGFCGLISFLETRKDLELEVVNSHENAIMINNEDYNWDKVFEDIVKHLDL